MEAQRIGSSADGEPRIPRAPTRQISCMVVVQPEQYVSYMLELHDHEALADSLVDILIDADSERRILRNPVRSVSMTSAIDLGGLADEAEARRGQSVLGR